MSQIRASQIRASQIRATEISSNHRELHGAIFFQVTNYVNLFRMEDDKERCMVAPANGDFETLTGEPPVTVAEWCASNALLFKQEMETTHSA